MNFAEKMIFKNFKNIFDQFFCKIHFQIIDFKSKELKYISTKKQNQISFAICQRNELK